MIKQLQQGTKVERISFVLLFLITTCFIMWNIQWGLPNSESWLSDSLAPFHPLLGLSKGFSGGYLNKYPPFHQMLLALLNLPVVVSGFSKIASSEGMQLMDIINLLQSDDYATPLILIDRLVSAFMGIATIYVVYRIGEELLNKRAALVAAAIAMLNPIFIFYAHVAKVEVPYLFWGSLAILYIIKAVRREKIKDYILSALFICLSYGTKDQAYALFVLPILCYVLGTTGSKWLARPDKRRDYFILIAAFSLSFLLFTIVTQNLIFNWEGFEYRFKILTGWNSQRSIKYTANLQGMIALARDTTRSIVGQIGWPFFLASVAGIIAICVEKIRKRDRDLLVFLPLVAALSYYIFFVQIIRQSSIRFSMPQALFLPLYAGYFIDRIFALLKNRTAIISANLMLIVLFILSSIPVVEVNLTMQNDTRYMAEKWMRHNIPAGSRIEYYAYKHYLPRFPESSYSYRVKKKLSDIESRTPDYVVISSHYYPRFLGKIDRTVKKGKIATTEKSLKFKTSPSRTYFEDLLDGQTAYIKVAHFKQAESWYKPATFARISPRHITIFKRREEKNSEN